MQNSLSRGGLRSFMAAIPKGADLTCMFGAFVFLQFTVLGLANHAGEGYLTTAQREGVYYALQVFVILGYVLHTLFDRFCTGRRVRGAVMRGIPGLFLACGALLFAARIDSLLYVIVSMAAALCVGGIGGAAHLRMSREAALGTPVARCMALGSSAAILMQYLLQIQWGVKPFLSVFMLAALLLLLFLLRRRIPETAPAEEKKREHTPTKRIVFSVLIAAIFILLACFYNEYIHHRQIQSGYAAYNVYSWPRLVMIPVYLLFILIGDRKGGKYVPIASLCMMLIALLNAVLTGSPGSYWLNMCLYYCGIASYTCYYLLTFWRLAPKTGHPAFWAPFGRMLDSAMVLFYRPYTSF